MEQPTDRDLITDHPFKQGAWWDDCVADIGGWPCGFSKDEHADPEEVPAEERWRADRVEDERSAEAERW